MAGNSLAYLKALNCPKGSLSELVSYLAPPLLPVIPHLPLPNEPFVNHWLCCETDSDPQDGLALLRSQFIEAHFPIQKGLSKDKSYRIARDNGAGLDKIAGTGLAFQCPEALKIELVTTAAGSVPAILTVTRADFITLVCAILHDNEPYPVPDSMGAVMVSGYFNRLRLRAWEIRAGLDSLTPCDARERLKAHLASHKQHYYDRFVLLSSGGYSGLSAKQAGFEAEDWLRYSHIIRREHEGTHYLTRRVLGMMRNHLLDELIADFVGLTAAFNGRFNADLFLALMGIRPDASLSECGRIHIYKGSLSPNALTVLSHLLILASHSLAQLTELAPLETSLARGQAAINLYRLGIDEIAFQSVPSLIKEINITY